MKEWRGVQKILDDVNNLKFDAHLRNFGNDFDMAKKQIQHCYFQKRLLKKKALKYQCLFDLPEENMIHAGINPHTLRSKREQFKQRYCTLKKAIAELEDGFGIMLVDRRLTLNGVKGNQREAPSKSIDEKIAFRRRQGFSNSLPGAFGEIADIHL